MYLTCSIFSDIFTLISIILKIFFLLSACAFHEADINETENKNKKQKHHTFITDEFIVSLQ